VDSFCSTWGKRNPMALHQVFLDLIQLSRSTGGSGILHYEGMSTSNLLLDRKREKMQKMTPKWSVSPDFASFYSQHFLANKGFN
jgi:hypothetical protein